MFRDKGMRREGRGSGFRFSSLGLGFMICKEICV